MVMTNTVSSGLGAQLRKWAPVLIVTLLVIAGFQFSPLASADELAPQVKSVSAGAHTCAVVDNGEVYCWGSNTYGQLGDDSTQNSETPVKVQNLPSATVVSAGQNHTCAIVDEGRVFCWGYTESGKTGDGGTGCCAWTQPHQVSGISDAQIISTGSSHTCAVANGGKGYCWGSNSYGRLGSGSGTSTAVPQLVSGLTEVTDISAGDQHSCAVAQGGKAYCWGWGDRGALGNGTVGMQFTPVAVSGLESGVRSIRAGYAHSCALRTDGTVACWGSNIDGALGLPLATNQFPTPVNVSGLGTAAALAAGQQRNCVVNSDRTVSCWGSKSLTGTPDPGNPTPTRVDVITNVAQVSLSSRKACAVTGGGNLYCWSANASGLAGTPTRITEFGTEPEPEPEPEDCTSTYFVGVRGSGESPQDRSLADYEASPGAPAYSADTSTSGLGDPLGKVLSEFESQMTSNQPGLPTVQVRAVAYPAIPVEPQLAYPLEYGRSVRVGADQLASALRQIKSECAQARVALAGYSQGADVVNTVMADVQRSGEKSLFGQVEKIVVLGDPAHRPNRAENIGNWWTLGSSNGYGVTEPIADNGTFAFKDANPGLVSSICFIGDLVCDTSSAAVHVGVQVHQMYSALTMECPAVNKAWQFGTTCAAQTLFQGFGYTPSTRQGGLYADQMVAQAGTHIWASIVAVIDIKSKITKLTGWFKSDPIEIGTFDVNEQGTAVIEFDIPDVPAGQHHLELVGDDGRMYRIPIYVTDEPVAGDSLMFTVDGSAPTVPPATDPTNPSDPTDPGGTGSIGSSQSPFGS